MRSIISVVLIFASLGFLGSCSKKINNPLSDPRPAMRNNVFTAKTANEGTLSSPIEKNYTNETPPQYWMKHAFGNSVKEVGYQYIGKGIVNDDSPANDNSKVDVYLISLKIGEKPTEYEAVFYQGGNKVVVDRTEIVISFNQGRANN